MLLIMVFRVTVKVVTLKGLHIFSMSAYNKVQIFCQQYSHFCPKSAKSWSGKTLKSRGILLKEPKMLLETMLFHTETRPCANFGNLSWQNDEVPLRCVLLMQNTLLYMHNISSAIIDSNWLNTFRYGHLKRFSNGKMQNFLWQSNQGGLPEFLSLWK